MVSGSVIGRETQGQWQQDDNEFHEVSERVDESASDLIMGVAVPRRSRDRVRQHVDDSHHAARPGRGARQPTRSATFSLYSQRFAITHRGHSGLRALHT